MINYRTLRDWAFPVVEHSCNAVAQRPPRCRASSNGTRFPA